MDVYVKGGNITAPAQAYPNFKPLVTDWIDPGLSKYRYAPYAGITVSAYRGTAPDGSPGNEAYPNDAYDRAILLLHTSWNEWQSMGLWSESV